MDKNKKIPVEISARHVHLTPEDVEILFGKNHELQSLKELSQPGMFAAKETLTVKCGEEKFDKVRIVGPARDFTQVEVSLSDARLLKMEVPVKLSGDHEGTPGFELIGPKGQI